MLRLIGLPFTVDIGRARRRLGYRPIVSWEQGVQAMQAARRLAGSKEWWWRRGGSQSIT
jgi:nucleoside-diphosphate-sugar epimerase